MPILNSLPFLIFMYQKDLCLTGNVNYRRVETSVLFDVALSMSRTIPGQKQTNKQKQQELN